MLNTLAGCLKFEETKESSKTVDKRISRSKGVEGQVKNLEKY